MGRPRKTGLDYFPKDVNYWNDYKIMKLLNKYGTIGTAVYDIIISEVYRNGYYLEIPLDMLAMQIIRIIGNEWVKNAEVIIEIINFCGETGLFNSELLKKGIITSVGIQTRYEEVKTKSKTDKSKYWLLSDNKNENTGVFDAETGVFAEETPQKKTKMPQSKVKESKVKESKVKESKVKESKVCDESEKVSDTSEKENYTHTDNILNDEMSFNGYDDKCIPEETYTYSEHTHGINDIVIPCKDGNFRIDGKYYSQLKQQFPEMDIDRSVRKLSSYLRASPEKQRKIRNVTSYINMWLNQDNDDGKYRLNSGYQPTYDISLYESRSVVDEDWD